MKTVMQLTLFTLMASLAASVVHAYPIDGYADTVSVAWKEHAWPTKGWLKAANNPLGDC